jgi:hypothetical protein
VQDPAVVRTILTGAGRGGSTEAPGPAPPARRDRVNSQPEARAPRPQDQRNGARRTSASPPSWLTFRPHHGHFGVSDGTGLRQPGHSTGSTASPVKSLSQALLE